MGNIGFPELVVIFVIALLIFGPKKLPELGKSLGKGINEFRRASSDLKNTIEREIESATIEPPPAPPAAVPATASPESTGPNAPKA